VKLICIMLTGGNREAVAPEAALSVADQVDLFVLIDTGTSEAAIAAIMAAVGQDKCVVYQYQEEFYISKGRNFAIESGEAEIAERGWDNETYWLMVLDTDERMRFRDVDAKAELATTDATVVICWDTQRRYNKERFFKVPVAGRYEPNEFSHEEFQDPNAVKAIHPTITFDEVPKSKEETDALMTQVEANCRRWITAHPQNPRPWFYLANTLVYFARFEEAKNAYLQHTRLTPHEMERGWSMYRIAMCHDEIGHSYAQEAVRLSKLDSDNNDEVQRFLVAATSEYEDGLMIACTGMRWAPYMPELPWAAAYLSLKLGRNYDCLTWANLAITLGETLTWDPLPLRVLRLGFQVSGWRTRADGTCVRPRTGPWESRRWRS